MNLHQVISKQKNSFKLITSQMTYMKETQDQTMTILAELQKLVSQIIHDQASITKPKKDERK